jgi:hypothetical protein
MAEIDIASGKNQETKKIRVVWGSADDIPTTYVNNLFISHAGSEFYLIFGELSPPIILGKGKEEIPESIVIKPVIKLAISPEAMIQMADVINGNLEKFEEHMQREKEEKEGVND